MEYLELYFLNYKYIIFMKRNQLKKVKKFWNGFLLKEDRYKEFIEWKIYFIKDENPSTEIDYEKKVIVHKHNSVCELTEFNNLFREIIVKISAMDGMVWMHSSAFIYKGKTFLVVGKKGDGKTTFLLKAIKNLDAQFIGNDQIPVFIEKKNICCYSWRPDIKICSNDFSDDEIDKKAKVLYLVNNKIPYRFIDYERMSKRLEKKIISPNQNLKIKCSNTKLSTVDYIFILRNQEGITEIKNSSIIEYIKDDPETILEFKLRDLNKYMSYWNKRIVNINIKDGAQRENKRIINYMDEKCRKFLIGNRMNFGDVQKYIELLSDEGENKE